MSSSNPVAKISITELLKKANALKAGFPGLGDAEPITKMTFRYWVRQGLFEKRARRGKGTKYPVYFAERAFFVHLLQRDHGLSLEHIRQVLAEVSPETISRVVAGQEPLERVYRVSDNVKERMKMGEQMIPLQASVWGQTHDSYSRKIKALGDTYQRSERSNVPFNPDDKFVRTLKSIDLRCATHNRDRWEWIGKEGKTYAEINAPNSEYRIQTDRGVEAFHLNQSSVDSHLKYDLKGGWIGWIQDDREGVSESPQNFDAGSFAAEATDDVCDPIKGFFSEESKHNQVSLDHLEELHDRLNHIERILLRLDGVNSDIRGLQEKMSERQNVTEVLLGEMSKKLNTKSRDE